MILAAYLYMRLCCTLYLNLLFWTINLCAFFVNFRSCASSGNALKFMIRSDLRGRPRTGVDEKAAKKRRTDRIYNKGWIIYIMPHLAINISLNMMFIIRPGDAVGLSVC